MMNTGSLIPQFHKSGDSGPSTFTTPLGSPMTAVDDKSGGSSSMTFTTNTNSNYDGDADVDASMSSTSAVTEKDDEKLQAPPEKETWTCANLFDGIISCGAGLKQFEVSPHLKHDSKIRNKFAAKIMAVLSVEALISTLIVCIISTPEVLISTVDWYWWLPLIPCALYIIVFSIFRIMQLSRKRYVNWILSSTLFLLMTAACCLMFPVMYWPYYLSSICVTFLVMTVLLYKCVDLLTPNYRIYMWAGIAAFITSILSTVSLHIVYYQTVRGEFKFFPESLAIVIGTIVISQITVYELRKMMQGRRMNLNDHEYIMAAVLL